VAPATEPIFLGRTLVLARLDDIDWKILRELQGDGRMTNVELARRVGISAPPCLRRVRALEEAGFIKGYRALLDGKELGFEVTAFAMVHLSSQAEADLTAFEEFVRAQPIVRECWMLSGEIDFVLKCVAPTLSAFQGFVADLTADTAQFEGRRDGAAGDARGGDCFVSHRLDSRWRTRTPLVPAKAGTQSFAPGFPLSRE
jgi:DNA-binding Lrp family transcriptional regulator